MQSGMQLLMMGSRPSAPTTPHDYGHGLCKATTLGATKKYQGKQVMKITEVRVKVGLRVDRSRGTDRFGTNRVLQNSSKASTRQEERLCPGLSGLHSQGCRLTYVLEGWLTVGVSRLDQDQDQEASERAVGTGGGQEWTGVSPLRPSLRRCPGYPRAEEGAEKAVVG